MLVWEAQKIYCKDYDGLGYIEHSYRDYDGLGAQADSCRDYEGIGGYRGSY